jgi:hypothetical protein
VRAVDEAIQEARIEARSETPNPGPAT